MKNALPYQLQDFQLLTLHCLGSQKNVILVSLSGTGKMICGHENDTDLGTKLEKGAQIEQDYREFGVLQGHKDG